MSFAKKLDLATKVIRSTPRPKVVTIAPEFLPKQYAHAVAEHRKTNPGYADYENSEVAFNY
jgi:hypothetical protein